MVIDPLLSIAVKNLRECVTLTVGAPPGQSTLLIYDEQSPLSTLITAAYLHILPEAAALNFDRTPSGEILKAISRLAPNDLVILVQSDSFRLNRFRIRIDLFNRRLKVIEHPHLARMRKDEFKTYLSALAYDPGYYRSVGPALKARIDRARQIQLFSGENLLSYDSEFETAKLNIGDYRGMKNTGGQFPIGEVFSEPKEITQVNGRVRLFAFGSKDFSVCFEEKPFSAIIENGILADAPDAPEAFHRILEDIRAEEKEVWLRELGFGLNRALTLKDRITDIGAYERMCGIHLSLGAKHALYPKPGFKPKKTKFHVDVFVTADQVEIDGETVFKDDKYFVPKEDADMR